MKYFLIFCFLTLPVFASLKTPSDVYSEAIVLKKMLVELRRENAIIAPLDDVEIQKNKLPRHVLQKSLEVLSKVNKYREIHNYGLISVPPVPPRKITPQDVYNNVERLKVEVSFLLKDRKVLKNKKFLIKKYLNKTPSDVYRELWIISLGFDKLLGQGFTPTDVYAQTEQIVQRIKFLRKSQRESTDIEMPKREANLHPNHALYKSVQLLAEISKAEKKLWMKSVPVPKIEERVISPTEVYDSLQTIKAELNRISRRLGIERSFSVELPKEKKTPSDVVQNIEYAIKLLPSFSFQQRLNQYPESSLVKTPSDVYALSEFILKKVRLIKDKRGIQVKAKLTPYVYGLKPIHVYVKGLENLEKISKLKALEGFHPSQIPSSPNTKITPSEVYELILRVDDELNLVYNSKMKDKKLIPYREYLDKKEYNDKTPSDVYNQLWKVSYELDTILNQEYTPNETYVLAKKMRNDVKIMSHYFLDKNITVVGTKYTSKRPEDVFYESLKLMDNLQVLKDRGNLKSVKISIPKEKIITPTSVYNALRIISGTISEIHVFYGMEGVEFELNRVENKTPSDVFEVVEDTNKLIEKILEDRSYEN